MKSWIARQQAWKPRRMYRSARVIVFMAVLTAPGAAILGAEEVAARADSMPRLLRKIEFGNYGSSVIRFGDLDGDGVPDAVLVQVEDTGVRKLTCLTAMTLEGKILWQMGKPDIRNIDVGSDVPIQIFDIDHDGQNEVIYIPEADNRGPLPRFFTLTILNGKTGAVKKQVKLSAGWDTILFADLAGRGYPQDLVIKDRYENFWVFDVANNFKLLWSKLKVNTGHYPLNYDFDGDGKEELLMGYMLYSHDGKELWSHPEFPEHDDAVYIDDMDGDGRLEIAMATSKDAVLLDAAGKIFFRKEMHHCQHALIGKFRQDLPGKQVCFIDIRRRMKDGDKFALEDSQVSIFDKGGRLLGSNTDNCMQVSGAVVDNWTGNRNEQFVLIDNRGLGGPVLLDGHAREVASFPFPPAIAERGGGPEGKDLYKLYWAQHLDCYGDEREEILVYDEHALYIYTNAALWQRPRLYNNTFYSGRR
jgi:rhamnogalacturonan endolyase